MAQISFVCARAAPPRGLTLRAIGADKLRAIVYLHIPAADYATFSAQIPREKFARRDRAARRSGATADTT